MTAKAILCIDKKHVLQLKISGCWVGIVVSNYYFKAQESTFMLKLSLFVYLNICFYININSTRSSAKSLKKTRKMNTLIYLVLHE